MKAQFLEVCFVLAVFHNSIKMLTIQVNFWAVKSESAISDLHLLLRQFDQITEIVII